MVKKFFHEIHLWLSIPLGILISVMCLTGAILVFESQALQALNPEVDLAKMGRHDKARTELRGYKFFNTTLRIHRWFLDAPAKRGESTAGKVATGVVTLAMLPILLSGLVLWWPRSRRALKNRLAVSCSKGWMRFWYDSHVSLGFYAFLLLLIMTETGLVWSFSWWREAFWQVLDFVPQENRRRFLYTLHTGLWGGVTTQVLYFIAALLGGILPLSGYYLWWKKRKNKQAHPSKK